MPDPFDPATYRVNMSLDAAAGVKQVLTCLTVRVPDRTWWVRRHSNYALRAWVIELKEARETYLVNRDLWPALTGEPVFRPKMLCLAVNRQGQLFLWSVRCPADDTVEPDRWMRAPLEALRLAKDRWTRISWNEVTKQHDVATCEIASEPTWPDRPFRDLLELAFKGFVIDTLDHPVLKKLRGESA
jgi:hypothetical protein